MELKDITPDRLTGLAVRMKKGDRRAAAELYDELASKVYGFLFTRTSNKEVAEDLSQDVFLKLVEKIDGYDPKRGRFVIWFWQMVRNMLIDYYREKKAIPFSTFEDETVAMMAVTEMPELDSKLEHAKIKEFLVTLSKEERELFELRYVADMSYKEISSLLSKSEGALRVATVRVKAKVRDHFKNNV